MKKKFAADIRKARDNEKMSREEFTVILGISATSVQKWEDAEVLGGTEHVSLNMYRK